MIIFFLFDNIILKTLFSYPTTPLYATENSCKQKQIFSTFANYDVTRFVNKIKKEAKYGKCDQPGTV